MRIEDFPNDILVDRFEQLVQTKAEVIGDKILELYVVEQRQIARDELLRRLNQLPHRH